MLKINAYTLHAMLKATLPCAATGAMIPALHGVHLSVGDSLHGNGPRLLATTSDRFTAAVSEGNLTEWQSDQFEVLIPLAEVKRLSTFLKGLGADVFVALLLDGDTLTVDTDRSGSASLWLYEGHQSDMLHKIHERFGGHVVNEDTSPRDIAGAVGFNPDHLARFKSSNLRRRGDGSATPLRMVLPKVDGEPVGFRYSDHFSAIVMPRRLGVNF